MSALWQATRLQDKCMVLYFAQLTHILAGHLHLDLQVIAKWLQSA